MPQTITQPLIDYLACCNPATTQEVSLLKYVFSRSVIDTSDTADIVYRYGNPFINATDIETHNGVGVPGILLVELTYLNVTTTEYLRENVNLDLTSSATFWTDINNWLILNDFNTISYDGILDRWLIDDITGQTYLLIVY